MIVIVLNGLPINAEALKLIVDNLKDENIAIVNTALDLQKFTVNKTFEPINPEKRNREIAEILAAVHSGKPLPKYPLGRATFDTGTEHITDAISENLEHDKAEFNRILQANVTYDKAFYEGWKANIACAFIDAYNQRANSGTLMNITEVANIAAENFLNNFKK